MKVRYTFEWDPIKARDNLRKHRISFERAAEIFLDPLAISLLDDEHSAEEIRWVTIGRDNRGGLVVLVHTFSEVSPEEFKVRVISARKADKQETNQYYEESEK